MKRIIYDKCVCNKVKKYKILQYISLEMNTVHFIYNHW